MIEIVAIRIWFEGNDLCLTLSNGESIIVPLSGFPRLHKATDKQRQNWQFIGKGRGIHWADINQDIWVTPLLRDVN